ncbi:MAG: hypothetical protein NXH85_11725 [Pseudomonadaceae bacterium]|nr:hypothetical protein [Pseudomonadaceae bacterium]
MIRFLDPRAPSSAQNEPYELAIDLPAQASGTVAFLANGFPDSVAFLNAVSDALKAKLPNLSMRHWNKGNASIPAPEEMLAEIEASSVAVIAAYGH